MDAAAIPAHDPVGDALQQAARAAAKEWGPTKWSAGEERAIRAAWATGEPWKPRLLERQARGRFVEEALRVDFRQLEWSRVGVDVVDPATGRQYEILSGTASNMDRHARRMSDGLFRMIGF